VNIVLERFVHDVLKMRAFGAIAIIIFTIIFVFFHRISEPIFGSFDVVGNLRQIGKF
jgi:hypothetical protein